MFAVFPPPSSKRDMDVGEASLVIPDGVASVSVAEESSELPDGEVSPESMVPEPGETMAGTGTGGALPEFAGPPLGGLAPPTLLGGGLAGGLGWAGGEVGWAGGEIGWTGGKVGWTGGKVDWTGGEEDWVVAGVLADVVVPGLSFWLLPPMMGARMGERIGIEGRAMGSFMSCGSRP